MENDIKKCEKMLNRAQKNVSLLNKYQFKNIKKQNTPINFKIHGENAY